MAYLLLFPLAIVSGLLLAWALYTLVELVVDGLLDGYAGLARLFGRYV